MGEATKTDDVIDVCCIGCILSLIAIALLAGVNYMGVSNPDGAIASILMMGIPALCFSLIYVGLQIRKTVATKD